MYYKPKEVAKLLNISSSTVTDWDNKGILKSTRTVTNRRLFDKNQIDEMVRKMKVGS